MKKLQTPKNPKWVEYPDARRFNRYFIDGMDENLPCHACYYSEDNSDHLFAHSCSETKRPSPLMSGTGASLSRTAMGTVLSA